MNQRVELAPGPQVAVDVEVVEVADEVDIAVAVVERVVDECVDTAVVVVMGMSARNRAVA